LRSQYVIFYTPSRAERDGKYRAIRVKVKRPDVHTATPLWLLSALIEHAILIRNNHVHEHFPRNVCHSFAPRRVTKLVIAPALRCRRFWNVPTLQSQQYCADD
jgi:hypothetical protein